MSGKGNSKARTESTSTTVTNTTNNVDNSITQGDFGAIDRAFNFGDTAIEAVSTAVRDVLDFSNDTNAAAFEAVDRAGERSAETFKDAFDFGRELTEQSGSLVSSLFEGALEAVTDVVGQGQLQLGNTVTALNQIARQQSTSADERVQGIAKYAIIGVAAVVGLIAVAIIARA